MKRPPFDGLNVSRETFERLEVFDALVQKWSPKINLVSKSSLSDLWGRHIWDSAQVSLVCPKARTWVDLGSGGGFPAIILAIFAKEDLPERKLTLIESDQRKSAFLRTAIRELDLNASVQARRILDVDPLASDVVSARALADLSDLLVFAQHHLAPNGTAVFLKGETWEKEVQQASESWSFTLNAHTSKTNPSAAILEIKDIQRV